MLFGLVCQYIFGTDCLHKHVVFNRYNHMNVLAVVYVYMSTYFDRIYKSCLNYVWSCTNISSIIDIVHIWKVIGYGLSPL